MNSKLLKVIEKGAYGKVGDTIKASLLCFPPGSPATMKILAVYHGDFGCCDGVKIAMHEYESVNGTDVQARFVVLPRDEQEDIDGTIYMVEMVAIDRVPPPESSPNNIHIYELPIGTVLLLAGPNIHEAP